ncbi:MAG: DUF2207 domain-containing protein [Myxococcota bacterium]
MSPRALAAALLLAGLLLPGAGTAEERIRHFRTDVAIEADGRFVVEERIRYDFGDDRKRGIFRDIPVAYGRGSRPDYRIALEVLAVEDGSGGSRPYRLSRDGRNQRIRIGDPDVRVTGEHEYVIRYRVRRGILWLEQHDELYWNATGTGWTVPIDHAEVTVSTPADRAAGETRAICFTGALGSLETACEHSSDGRMTYVEASRPFRAGEGLTVAVALPKGMLDEPSDWARRLDRASDFVSWATALPFVVFFGMFGHWWRNGRDPAGPDAIPVRYEPPEGMTPGEMGVLRDQSADTVDITATLLDLAVRRVLRIEEVESRKFLFLSETDYVLHRLGANEESLKRYEREILDALFGSSRVVNLSSLKNRFYTSLPGIKEALYEEVSKEGGWFPASPDRVRGRYAIVAVTVGIPLVVLAILFHRPALAVSMGVCTAILLAFSRVMPRRTRKGRRDHQHVLGFQEFVERVEIDRLERLGMRNIESFERLLPYAFVLGVADPWAEAFAGLYTAPPDWFVGGDGDRFLPRRLVDRVGRAMDTAGSTMTSAPRSSGGSGSSGFGGGGFSGGGFGGGGGGSW